MTRINAMTVDVEDYFHVSALSEVISRRDWASMEFRAERSTNRLLEMFAEKNVKATFFVLGWVTARGFRAGSARIPCPSGRPRTRPRPLRR